MLERLNTYVTRRAIARAMTEQCDIDESNVVAKNVHIISSEPTMLGFDIVFTINGEDGEQFTTSVNFATSVSNDGVFGETYVGKIELAVPKYDHEVYYLRKNASGFYVTRRKTVGTTQTRDEWLVMLHQSGELDMVVGINMLGRKKDFSNLGHPIFTTADAAEKYALDLNIRNTVDSMLDKLDMIASEPKPVLIEVWGIKPLSKEPVMLSAVDAASFDQACFILMEESKIGITMERDSRTRAYFYYNGRPVFRTKEAAQKCIDNEYGGRLIVNEAFSRVSEALKGISFSHYRIPTLDLQALGSTITIDVPKKRLHKVSDIKCFKQLASVIGKGQAQVELFKVMHNESCWVDIDVDDFSLALDWALTPQGYDYWESLYAHIRKEKESNHNGCKSQ